MINMETTKINTLNNKISIDELITNFKELYKSNQRITFLHEGYLKFKRLILASLLMDKIDEALNYYHISE